MNIVGYGGGTNSTAMLIGLYHRKIPVDLILFSNTGGEQPHTYDFLPIMDRWLEEHGLPTITQVEYTDRNGERLTLEQECLRSGSLPAIAYGYKKCSLKHKVAPQDKFCNNYPPCREAWARGERIVKFIGFDIGEQNGGTMPSPLMILILNINRNIRSWTGAGCGRTASLPSSRRACRCLASLPVFFVPV